MYDVQNSIMSIRNALIDKSTKQCPKCNSPSIVSDGRTDGKMIMEYFHCEDCNAKWINQYEFSGQFMILMPE